MVSEDVVIPAAGLAVFGLEKGEGQGFRIFAQRNLFAVFGDWEGKSLVSPPGSIIPKEGEILHVRTRVEHDERLYECLAEYMPCGQRFDGRPAYIGGMVFAKVAENEGIAPEAGAGILDELLRIAGREGDAAKLLESSNITSVPLSARKDWVAHGGPYVLDVVDSSDRTVDLPSYRMAFYLKQTSVNCSLLLGACSRRLREELEEFIPAEMMTAILSEDEGRQRDSIIRRIPFDESPQPEQVESDRVVGKSIRSMSIFSKRSQKELPKAAEESSSSLVDRQLVFLSNFQNFSDGGLDKISKEQYWLEDTYAALFATWRAQRQIDGFIHPPSEFEDGKYIMALREFDKAAHQFLRGEGMEPQDQDNLLDDFYHLLAEQLHSSAAFRKVLTAMGKGYVLS